MMKDNETGRSMIEMLGVLAIIGVLSVGGIAGYSKAMMKYRTNKTIEQISMIVTNVRTLFGTQKSYKALGDTTNGSLIAKARLFPDELLVGTEGIVSKGNPFGGDIYLTAGDRFAKDDNKSFVLAFDSIPEEACMDLATQDWGSASGSGLIEANVVAKLGQSDGTTTCTDPDDETTCTTTGASAGAVVKLAEKITTCSTDDSGKGPMTAAQAAAVCGNDSASSDTNFLILKFY